MFHLNVAHWSMDNNLDMAVIDRYIYQGCLAKLIPARPDSDAHAFVIVLNACLCWLTRGVQQSLTFILIFVSLFRYSWISSGRSQRMVHFSQSLMPDVSLATSLPITFTFHPNNQLDEQPTLQQQSIASTSSLSSSSSNQLQRSSPSNDDRNANANQQTSNNDYETRLR